MEVPEAVYFYIKVQSTGDSGDWGSQNEWRLEYLRVYCEDRKSFNEGVMVNVVHDGDNLYPYKGAGTDDYYEFACSASNEESSTYITRISLTAESIQVKSITGPLYLAPGERHPGRAPAPVLFPGELPIEDRRVSVDHCGRRQSKNPQQAAGMIVMSVAQGHF